MKKFILFYVFFLTGILYCNAQNLISNGSFEFINTIPNQTGQITEAIGWKSSGQSPDLFHDFSAVISGVNIPFTFAGAIPKAHEGQVCVGICSFMKGWTNYREYLSYKLDSALKAGNDYTVSLYVLSNPTPLLYGGLSTDNFAVAFSNKKLHTSSDGIIHYTPQCILTTQLYAFGWKKISFNFYADSNYKFITIGCFVNDSIQVLQNVDSAYLFSCVYTFIDNVSVIQNNISTSVNEVIFVHPVTNRKTKLYDLLGREIFDDKLENHYQIKLRY